LPLTSRKVLELRRIRRSDYQKRVGGQKLFGGGMAAKRWLKREQPERKQF